MAVRTAQGRTDYAPFEARFGAAILGREAMVGIPVTFRLEREAIVDALRFLRDDPPIASSADRADRRRLLSACATATVSTSSTCSTPWSAGMRIGDQVRRARRRTAGSTRRPGSVANANWAEREAFDQYGVVFDGTSEPQADPEPQGVRRTPAAQGLRHLQGAVALRGRRPDRRAGAPPPPRPGAAARASRETMILNLGPEPSGRARDAAQPGRARGGDDPLLRPGDRLPAPRLREVGRDARVQPGDPVHGPPELLLLPDQQRRLRPARSRRSAGSR